MKDEHIHRDWHGAHHPWAYRQNCFRWFGTEIVGINLLPLAAEMRAWLQQEGNLSLPPDSSKEGYSGYCNPYTLSGSALGIILARVVNAWHHYANSELVDHDEVDAEIDRLRLYNEVVLYAARFCEASIKQLLYCTHIPEKQYQRMALGALLESPCPSCKKPNGDKPHSISLVGTLAHPFHLCIEFEQCAMDHMALVNKLRNNETAHSSIQALDFRTAAQSKAHLAKDCDDILTKFVHMLSHLEKLEQDMLKDLTSKGEEIMLLKKNGLTPEDCNFNLVPGYPVIVQNTN